MPQTFHSNGPLRPGPHAHAVSTPSPVLPPPPPDGAPVLPISAQLKYNVDVVAEYIVNKVSRLAFSHLGSHTTLCQALSAHSRALHAARCVCLPGTSAHKRPPSTASDPGAGAGLCQPSADDRHPVRQPGRRSGGARALSTGSRTVPRAPARRVAFDWTPYCVNPGQNPLQVL